VTTQALRGTAGTGHGQRTAFGTAFNRAKIAAGMNEHD